MSERKIYRPNAFVERHPGAFSYGSLRWILFRRRHELEQAGALIRNGRTILIDEDRFFQVLERDQRRPGDQARHAS